MNQKAAELAQRAADLDAARSAAEAAKADELAKAKKSFDDLATGLKSEIAAGEIKITQLQGKLTVNLVDRILFDSGKAEIKDDGRKVLDKVGGILNTVGDKNIRIEGHTDNKPIVGDLLSKYPSNWELSTARATAVARYLQDKDKVDPSRLVAAGYGEFRPVAPNDTAESRALNRRIEIVLVPKE
jgi:chemotaxis protein MotB